MSTRKRQAKSPSTRTRRPAVFRRLLGGSGSGAPARHRLTLFSLAILGLLLVPASSAFALAEVSVVKAGAGSGTGTVTSEPAGIACGSECGPKQFLTAVKLTATAGPGFIFSGWSGATCAAESAPNKCELAPEFADRIVTATFIPVPDPPKVVTAGVSEGQQWYLKAVAGTVNPVGSPVTDCFFQYGATADYGTKVPCMPDAGGIGEGAAYEPVNAETEPLEPNTTYHYRLVASNLGGSGTGEDRTFTTGSAPPDPCPNAARRAEQGIAALALPDCMALEMASPPQTHNDPSKQPSVSADGERVLFYSPAALAETPGLNSIDGDAYVASRGTGGWEVAATSPPQPLTFSFSKYPQAFGFNSDFSTWLQAVSTQEAGLAGAISVYQAGLAGTFTQLSPELVPPPGSQRFPDESSIERSWVEAVSPDQSHAFIASNEPEATYLPGDPIPAPAEVAGRNVYVVHRDSAGEPTTELVTRDATGKVWGGRCGAGIGGDVRQQGDLTVRTQGAVSSDGTMVYFTTRPSQPAGEICKTSHGARIMRRVESSSGPQISELFQSECTRVSPPCSTADGDDVFQGASVDGDKVYFTTTRQLTESDADSTADLYLYDAAGLPGHRLVQVSAGGSGDATPGSGAEVRGNVATISTDGTRVYFSAAGVLTTTPSPSGRVAAAGALNLYAWDSNDGDTTFIGTLAPSDEQGQAAQDVFEGTYGLLGQLPGYQNQAYAVPASGQSATGAEIGGDGHILAFQTHSSLVPQDTDGGYLDVYRYDADSDELRCLSCRPGNPDAEPFGVLSAGYGPHPMGPDFLQLGRWMSEDGNAVSFVTAEPMVPGDDNGVADVYLWRNGRVIRLPGGAYLKNSSGGARKKGYPILSANGDEVVWATAAQLLPADGDTAPDVYLARVDGGFPGPSVSPTCEGESCLGAGSPPASPAGIATTRSSSGNQLPRCRRGMARRHGRCIRRKCRGRRVRRHRSCVKLRRHMKHRRHHHHRAATRPQSRSTHLPRRAAK